MKIPIFELERVQSIYENTVEYNLTESGFHPLTLSELLNEAQIDKLKDTVIGYGQTNGSISLRDRIAALYEQQSVENVLVTNGSSEANFVACHTLLEAGYEVVMMVPNYMQIWGIVEEMGAVPKAFHLREENEWAPDLDELRGLVNDRTKMIAICNPNNPTGYTLTDDEMREIVEIVLTLCRPLVAERELQLINAIPADLPMTDGDENRLQQVMHNLVGNALKFTDRGAITVEAQERHQMVEVAVCDTGIGIPEGRIERIFESFEQVDASTARRFGGTGLGLTITRQLVELHGGTIWVQSVAGSYQRALVLSLVGPLAGLALTAHHFITRRRASPAPTC